MDDKDFIINHLKHLIQRTEKDIKEWEEKGIHSMMNYEKGMKAGLELAVEWIELQDE